jgi:putative ABC transport system permease protein
MTNDTSLLLAIGLLVVLLLVVGWVGQLGQNRDALVVVIRAVTQLALVGFVIRAVILRPALAPLYLALMLTVAAYTSSRRIRGVRSALSRALMALLRCWIRGHAEAGPVSALIRWRV